MSWDSMRRIGRLAMIAVERGLEQPVFAIDGAIRAPDVQIADQALAVFENVVEVAGDLAVFEQRRSR